MIIRKRPIEFPMVFRDHYGFLHIVNTNNGLWELYKFLGEQGWFDDGDNDLNPPATTEELVDYLLNLDDEVLSSRLDIQLWN